MKRNGPSKRDDTNKNTNRKLPQDAPKKLRHAPKKLRLTLTTTPPVPEKSEKDVFSEKNLPTTLNTQAPEISPDITQFFQRIKTNATLFKEIANELSHFILPNDLKRIYEDVLHNQEFIQKEIMKKGGIRLPKEITGLKRTLNIVLDPIDGSVALILDTKHKTASGEKDPSIPTFNGTTKKGTHAYRIDSTKPQRWVNLVMRTIYNETPDGINKLKEEINLICNEINIARILNINSQTIAHELGHPLFQTYSPGAGFVKPSASGAKTYKVSLYSPSAIGNLCDIIRAKKQYNLTEEDKKNISLSLLKEVKVLHDNGIIHQDIKSANILIYKKENGQYYAKLSDFGNTNNTIAVASYTYESPEISQVYRDINSCYHSYLQKNRSLSYGKYIADNDQSIPLKEIMSFSEPHASNDMWALGIVLYELYSEHTPVFLGANPQVVPVVIDNPEFIQAVEEKISENPLLAGLLNPRREQRFTANDAIEIFEKHINKNKIK